MNIEEIFVASAQNWSWKFPAFNTLFLTNISSFLEFYGIQIKEMADVEFIQDEPTNGKDVEEKKDVSVAKDEVKKEDSVPDDDASHSDLTQLERDIIRQIEYYFSENNLRRDKFLIQKVGEADGWVDINVLLTFNRLKAITEDAEKIADAVVKSPHGTVQVSEDRLKLRRHPDNPLPEFNETRRKEVQARTAYAKGFPLDSNLTTLIDYFNNNFENVEQVSRI